MPMETKMLSMYDPKALTFALEILKDGGLVAFPTDTVYGLGALAFDERAVSRISDVKGRLVDKAIPILIGSYDQVERVASGVNAESEKLARRFWPGPLTIILPRHVLVPEAVTPFQTVGVRIPDFAATIELLKMTGPMAVSSANLTGMGSSTTARGVQTQLDGKIPLILDGGVTPGGIPSTVMDCMEGTPNILRQGPISLEQLLEVLQR
jgi:L-threonylcarbamoyladenylate synthase